VNPAHELSFVHAAVPIERVAGMTVRLVGSRDVRALHPRNSQHVVRGVAASAEKESESDDAAAEDDEQGQEGIVVAESMVWIQGWFRAWSDNWTQTQGACPALVLVQW
jgi:hypothetical protein